MSEHPKKVVLLDLDGTLTKSDPGIIGCVVKTFMEMGYPVPDDDELHRFIGPAISESLQRNGIPDDSLDEGVRIYRKYYADEAVYYLAIASCKPQYQCIPICEHFHLDTMVDGIYGASKDNSRLDKDQVIRWAFQHIGFDENAGDKALMVGDRWTDADGAKACGLDCLGCGWGYAEPGELKAHGAYRVLDSVDGLAQAVEEYFA